MSVNLENMKTEEGDADGCYHCGEPVPDDVCYETIVLQSPRSMCCQGCQAVATTIVDYGLEDFYRYRTEKSRKPENIIPTELQHLGIYDEPEIQSSFVESEESGSKSVALILEDIVCPACCWLIEKQVSGLEGVNKISVNYSSNRARLSWNEDKIRLSDVLGHISTLGYRAYPYDPHRGQLVLEQERKQQLRRIGLAGLLGMQVMMISIALYFGEWFGMEEKFQHFFHWIALFLTLPIVFYSARPFFVRAWRDLSLFTVSMDVPVSLGIAIAFIASFWATVTGSGTVYYDSAVMFVFLLSGGRYFEFMARMRATEHINSLEKIIPATATRLRKNNNGFEEEPVPVIKLEKEDIIVIRPGETVPTDGTVIAGNSSVSEALVTGEGMPITKQPGEPVIGGSNNIESPIQVRVTKVGKETMLAQILRLLEEGRREKPALTILTNRIAGWFVLFVLSLALLVGSYWYSVPGADWVAITIAVLIVSCPCALSLATPTALTTASSALIRHGIAVIKMNAIETLTRVTHFVFDKTGTLSFGRLTVSGIQCFTTLSEQRCIQIAAAMERYSEHPVGKAIVGHCRNNDSISAEFVKNYPGEGICATIDNTRYFLGNTKFIKRMAGHVYEVDTNRRKEKYVLLGDADSLLCVFYLNDELRPGAHELVRAITQSGEKTALLSGDDGEVVKNTANELGMTLYWGEQLPEEKLQRIQELKDKNHVVAMVGDGINDAPVMAASHLSIAVGSGTELAKAQADMVVLNSQPGSVNKAIQISHGTMRTIKQNMAWAIAYNLSALPLAALAYIPPWLAALGMSLSSLIVVLNSARLARL